MRMQKTRKGGVETPLMLIQCVWYVTVMVVTLAILSPHPITAFVILFSEEPMIVSQETYTGPCVDLFEEPSSPGACDKIVYHVEPSGNYTVTHSCRPREPSENPDTTNCVWESDTGQAFPDCCPTLSCSAASALTTIDPQICRDIAQSFSCEIWKNLTSGCTDPSSDVYNITQTFCNNTCGLC